MIEPDIKNRERYAALGVCMYCGARDKKLTKEHIIPYALAGTLVLPSSSCIKCAAITGNFEQRCCRLYFDHIRKPLKLPSRKGKKRRGELPVLFTSKESKTLRRQYINTADSPTGLGLPVFPVPGILQNIPEINCRNIQISHWRFGPKEAAIKRAAQSLGASAIAAHFDLPALARLLAKIAYGYAVAELGIDGFTSSITDVILGKNNLWAYRVGGADKSQFHPTGATVNHLLGLHIITTEQHEHLLSVSVQLFSNFEAPCYQAVIGILTEEQLFQVKTSQ